MRCKCVVSNYEDRRVQALVGVETTSLAWAWPLLQVVAGGSFFRAFRVRSRKEGRREKKWRRCNMQWRWVEWVGLE